jgi:hypothetical protein
MHGILAITAVYRRYLTAPFPSGPTVQELYHMSRCTSLFNKRLSIPIAQQDRDAIWATASVLGILAFLSLEESHPAESWPLSGGDPPVLEWMRMGDGKRALWHLADPLRPDSVFSTMASIFAQMHAPLTPAVLDGVPGPLARLCGLDESSTADGNPFFTVAHVVSDLYNLPDAHVTTGRALAFWTHMPPGFKVLLRQKDAVALLILYLWYCRARVAAWWIGLRARVECPAILTYLRRYHRGETAIHTFLLKAPCLWGQRR